MEKVINKLDQWCFILYIKDLDENNNPDRALHVGNVSVIDSAICQQFHQSLGKTMHPNLICMDNKVRTCKVNVIS